ncbi:Homebox and aldo/keto reductase [Phytophthora megakarya]|uniref:Homebox and aldo/keto reductase n=1 Tax=Phytophthora megakarya TaxID=4795 RepID=A0A225WEB6_9STRA|nr:Homebox and aldo/keto reductase [Phytophthora megakarya]
MTFPNRTNYQLRPREKSQRPQTASDAPTFPTRHPIHNHALLPLTHKLMALISQPTKLLAALVVDLEPRRVSKQQFWAKALTFQHAELIGICGGWSRIMEDIHRYELTSTDVMMLKAVLYYWRLWQFVCVTCVEAIGSIEESATSTHEPPSLLHKRRAASITSSPSLEESLAQGMVMLGSGGAKRSRITKKSNEFLVAWFLAHKENPYPSPDERVEIAEKTGLAEQQVRNWFANMRKRHWKPNRSNAKKPRCLLDYVLRQTEA